MFNYFKSDLKMSFKMYLKLQSDFKALLFRLSASWFVHLLVNAVGAAVKVAEALMGNYTHIFLVSLWALPVSLKEHGC